MAGEISFQVPWESIKNSNNNNDIVLTSAQPYRDVKIQLGVYRRRSDDGNSIATGIKVTMASDIKMVRLSCKIMIENGSRRTTLTDSGSNTTSYDDPNIPGCQYGEGPFNMNLSQISFSNIESRFLHSDGTLRFVVQIYNRYYYIKHDMSSMMKKISNFLEKEDKDLDLGGSQSTIRKLHEQISLMEAENSQTNQELNKIVAELEQKKQAMLDQERQVISLQKSNQDLGEENKELTKQVAETKKKLEALNTEITSCQFVDALAGMKPDQVRLGECDKNGLQDFQRKLLVIQKMILKEITSKETCQSKGCQNTMDCAMMPCKHLAYCFPCYQKIDQERKTPPSSKKKKKGGEEKPFEPKPLSCPICSTEVGQVINVRQ